MNLQSLDLAGNQIRDLTPLKGLTHLQYLELSNNQVAKRTLAGLTSLTSLYLTGNKVSDIGPLGTLTKLWSLYLGHNQIKDIAALAKVTKISTLELKENQISDLTPLKKQTELMLLLVERNKITDLTPLTEMCKADSRGEKRFAPYLRLYLAGNPLGRQRQVQAACRTEGLWREDRARLTLAEILVKRLWAVLCLAGFVCYMLAGCGIALWRRANSH